LLRNAPRTNQHLPCKRSKTKSVNGHAVSGDARSKAARDLRQIRAANERATRLTRTSTCSIASSRRCKSRNSTRRHCPQECVFTRRSELPS
jgi:hypothetical protein